MAAEWFYAENGQQRGPVNFEELQQRASADLLKPMDLIWRPGLSEWIPASTQPGLFGGGAVPVALPPPRRIPRDYDEAELFERARPSGGMSTGVKILLISCGGLMLMSLLCCGVFALIGRNARLQEQNRSDRRWTLKSGEYSSWSHKFKQGDDIIITVNSNTDSDMDLYVFTDEDKLNTFLKVSDLDRAVGLCLAYDIRLDWDCRVEFAAPETREYRVLLINRRSEQAERNIANSGRIVVEVGDK